jgi:hypothetical protein
MFEGLVKGTRGICVADGLAWGKEDSSFSEEKEAKRLF